MSLRQDPQGPEAVAGARERRDRLDPWLRAFIARDDEAAPGPGAVRAGSVDPHDVGSRASAGTAGGVLDGLPVAVKGVRGRRTPAVRRLLAAGAVPIGATSVPRGDGHQTWGWTDRGPTRNPWRGDRSPGGSSAGSAAAVAAGIVPLATGSDGAGSVRIPAAWCGVLGYKPTTGLVPGTDPSGLATPGVLVRDPALLPAWLDAVAGEYDRGSTHRLTAPGTVAWSPDLGFAHDQLDPAVVAIARTAADRWVRSAGLDEIEVPLRLRDPAPAWTALRRADHSPASAAQVRAAHVLRAANDRALRELFARVDLLLAPATPAGPHGHDGPGRRMNVALTWAFNLSGHPAASVPAGIGPDGCPVGLQVVARSGQDDRLLAFLGRHVPPADVIPAGSTDRLRT